MTKFFDDFAGKTAEKPSLKFIRYGCSIMVMDLEFGVYNMYLLSIHPSPFTLFMHSLIHSLWFMYNLVYLIINLGVYLQVLLF